MAQQVTQGSGVSSEEIGLTDEDRAIFFRNLGETARHATRAEFAEPGELSRDAGIMARITGHQLECHQVLAGFGMHDAEWVNDLRVDEPTFLTRRAP